MHRSDPKCAFLVQQQISELGPEDAHRVFQQRLKYRLQFTGRRSDDFENLSAREAPSSVIFLADICPPGSPAEITSPATSKAHTEACATSLPVARAHSNSVSTLAPTTTNTSNAALIYETGIFYWRATHRADTNGM